MNVKINAIKEDSVLIRNVLVNQVILVHHVKMNVQNIEME